MHLNLVMLQLLCRCSGLMASELDSRSGSLGLSPGWGHLLGSCAKHLKLLSQCLSPPKY